MFSIPRPKTPENRECSESVLEQELHVPTIIGTHFCRPQRHVEYQMLEEDLSTLAFRKIPASHDDSPIPWYTDEWKTRFNHNHQIVGFLVNTGETVELLYGVGASHMYYANAYLVRNSRDFFQDFEYLWETLVIGKSCHNGYPITAKIKPEITEEQLKQINYIKEGHLPYYLEYKGNTFPFSVTLQIDVERMSIHMGELDHAEMPRPEAKQVLEYASQIHQSIAKIIKEEILPLLPAMNQGCIHASLSWNGKMYQSQIPL